MMLPLAAVFFVGHHNLKVFDLCYASFITILIRVVARIHHRLAGWVWDVRQPFIFLLLI